MLRLIFSHTPVALLTALLFLLPLSSRAAENLVTEVGVRSASELPVHPSYVKAQTEVRVDDPFDRAAVSRDVRRLLATGRFSFVSVEVEPDVSGIKVTYVVEPRLQLAREIIVNGDDKYSKRRIRKWSELNRYDFFDEQLLETAGRKVRQKYRDAHFKGTEITWEVDKSDPSNRLTNVTLTIEEGEKVKAKRAEFTGNTVFKQTQLRDVVGLRPWWNPVRYFSHPKFDSAELASAESGIRSMYLDRGYLDARVDNARVEKDDEGEDSVKFDISEGPVYVVGNVRLSGVRKLPLISIRNGMRLRPGAVASRRAIAADSNSVRDYYGSRGYMDTYVRLSRDVVSDSPPTVDLAFDVSEGELTFIRNVNIRGNMRTRDSVIRREVLVYPGEVYNEVNITRTERRLMNTGYFSSVKNFNLPTSLSDQRDLVYEVEEKSTGQFMMGVGYSSVDNITGFFEVSQSNFDIFNWPHFTGGGQKIKLHAQVSSNRRDYEVSFVEPWFLNRRLRMGLDVYNREQRYDDYDVRRTGFGAGLTRQLTVPRFPILSGQLGLRYGLEQSDVQDDDIDEIYVYYDDPTEEYDFADDEGKRTTSSLELKWTRDRRNHPFRPSSGYRTIAFGRVAGGALGFDTDIYRLGARARWYFPLWLNHVLSVRGRIEVVDAYGGTEDVPIDERLFLGGGRTVRGYEYRDVGPKVIPADETPETATEFRPVGGNSMAMWSIEYTVPLNNTIRLAAFYDEGNVWKDAYDFDLSETASSAGVGIRFDMPGFPIRLDYAWSIEPDDDLTREDLWSVWIGVD